MDNSRLENPTPSSLPEEIIETPEPTNSPSNELIGSELVEVITQDERSVYGDVSDSILAKLSAYYNEYGNGKDYAIYRSSDTTYYLVFGDFEDGRFDNAILCTYTSSTYQSYATFNVASVNNFRPDNSGNTAYYYSSVDPYLPSRYINTKLDNAYKSISIMCVIMILCILFGYIGWFFSSIVRRYFR